MGNKKKMVFNVLFLVLIFAGTIYGVFHGEDIGQISDILQTVNLGGLYREWYVLWYLYGENQLSFII